MNEAFRMNRTKAVSLPVIDDLRTLITRLKQHNPQNQLSPETNIYMLRILIDELGPKVVQKLCKILTEKGEIKWEESDDFEVEAIVNVAEETEDGTKKVLYLVKWKGWTSEHNTWEPREHLVGCDNLLEQFEFQNPDKRYIRYTYDKTEDTQKMELEEFISKLLKTQQLTVEMLLSVYDPKLDRDRARRIRQRKISITQRQLRQSVMNKRSKNYKLQKILQKSNLEKWEQHLRQVYAKEPMIKVENEVDLEVGPADFEYITESMPMEGITVPTEPVIGCECVDCTRDHKNCCPNIFDQVYAYRSNKRIRIPVGYPITECNSKCKCGPECSNRVVQLGRKYKLCVFRTETKGWGVKTLQRIPKGAFVLEYVGEIITSEEAEKRGHLYDSQSMTYLFDLDFHSGDNYFTIDAKRMGNVSHFINHSCDPNLSVYGVWVEHPDVHLPRLAFFSNRDIASGEELTFDYQMTQPTIPSDEEMEIESSNGSVKESSEGEVSMKISSDSSESKDTSETGSEQVLQAPECMDTDKPVKAVKKLRFKCACGTKKCRDYFF